MAKYYTLLLKDDAHSPWGIAFGDYDRDVVVDEYEDCYTAYYAYKIIRTDEDQAAIEDCVSRLNDEEQKQMSMDIVTLAGKHVHCMNEMERKLGRAIECEKKLREVSENVEQLSRLAFIVQDAVDLYKAALVLPRTSTFDETRDAYKEILRIGSLYA